MPDDINFALDLLECCLSLRQLTLKHFVLYCAVVVCGLCVLCALCVSCVLWNHVPAPAVE